jgi:hypothetical protein
LDSVGEWLETTPEATSGATKVKSTSSSSKPTTKDTNGTSGENPPRLKTEDDEPDWSWQVPDLQPGGAWYNDQVCNLRQAVATLGSPVQLYLGGFEILEIHRQNYSTEGPKNLQLLLWEFPPESWEAIREGSSMNFMVTPKGEIKPNSPMTEEEQAVTGRFVDELIRLQVLVPVVNELRANCPLFCVEKPHKPGTYRSIVNAKAGRQNACMGKDPVYLTRADDILPRLYHGGWTTVADASKHFHNFLT